MKKFFLDYNRHFREMKFHWYVWLEFENLECIVKSSSSDSIQVTLEKT